MIETAAQPHDRPDRTGRRRPFSTLIRKLANFKNVSSGDGSRHISSKDHHIKTTSKKRHSKNNNPYPSSGRIPNGVQAQESQPSFSTAQSGAGASSAISLDRDVSLCSSVDDQPPPTAGGRSVAPTVSTDHETSRSMTARSHGAPSLAGTSRTANGGLESRRGGDSTFSSPAPSVRSLTTTLTTIQSIAPNGTANPNLPGTNSNTHQTLPFSTQAIQFNQPFPTASPAVSAIPPYLTPSAAGNAPGHPTTYSSATANNLLTDNASILTLASSSKRRRRRSFDTDASVRALAPSSLWGGSRESLPLSILSTNIDVAATAAPATPGLHRGTSAVAGQERSSIYSATGILASERNSFYAKQQQQQQLGVNDGASVRSGFLSHGRADSISGSIGGGAIGPSSPLASPFGIMERKGSGVEERDDEDDEYGRHGNGDREAS